MPGQQRETNNAPARLHDYWRSSASYRVRIALNLKSVGYTSQPVDLLKGEQRAADYLKRNPQGLVPSLEIDGLRLTQSLAIIEYLDETRPEPPLLPDDATGRARVRSMAEAIAMEIHPICNTGVVAHVVELVGGGEATKVAWMQRHIEAGLNAFEKLLDHPATGRFCHGDRPRLADCCLMPQLYNARRWGLEPSVWHRITRIEAACNEIDAFQKAQPDQVRPPQEA